MKEKFCERCGKKMAADAPEGICPSCLMEANLGTEAATLATGKSGKAEPRSVEEVARLFPELEILELLGAGGMGAVYKVRQPKLERLVALKVLHRDEREAGFVERFSREAKTLARLNHPNIVAVYDFGERDGWFFLIMELVDGATLRQLLGEGKMKPEAALAIVPPICEALQYAHEKGVVHRDIKPENILVDKEGRVKVADFGIARLAGAVEGERNLTGEGQVVGTAHYMAPEQVERPAEVDHRADIYALGVVFYEMLTGELPLGRFPEPSRKVQVDVRLDEVVLKALEKEPARRYQTAGEMRTGVETVGLGVGSGGEGGVAEMAERERKPWWAFCAAWTFAGTILFGLVCQAILGGVPGGWLIGVFVFLACVTPIGAMMAMRYASGETVRMLFRTSGWLAFLAALPMLGFGAFFLFALSSEGFAWNPHPTEAVAVPLIWVGAGLLPWCGFVLRTAGAEPETGAGNAGRKLGAGALRIPAFGLMAVAGIDVVAAIYFAVSVLVRGDFDQWVYTQWLGVGLAGGAVILCGAAAMLRVRDRNWAVAGSLAAMVLPPGMILGIPFGIWALVALSRRDVKEAFAARAKPVLGNGIRKRSEREIFGWPLWSVAMGPDVSKGEMRGHARGVFAVGDVATGWLALGGVARGGVAVGGVAVGVVSIGGAAIGLLGALGGFAGAVILAVGGAAVGFFAAGGGAAGYYAVGGGSWRVHDFGELAGWHEAVSVPENLEEYSVRFPNGVSVEVAAVCRNPRNAEAWWRPDGTLLPAGTVEVVSGLEETGMFARIRAEREREAAKARFGVGKTSENTPENEVLIYVRREYPPGWPDDLHGHMLEWSRPPSRMEVRRFPNVRWRGGEIGSAELLWFAEVPEELDLTVTLPMGPWEPVAIFDGRETRELADGVEAEFRRGGAGDHEDLLFEISHNVDFRKHGLRVMARMRDGSSRQVFQQSTGENSDGGFRTYLTFSGNPGLKLEVVKEFELARTELAARRIEGIRLKPEMGAKTYQYMD